MMRIWKEFSFDAGHYLEGLPPEHKCSHQHGHTYRFRLYVAGGIVPSIGWIVDWGGLVRAAAEMILKELDHKNLNEVEGLPYATCEMLTKWIFDRVAVTQLAPLTSEELEYYADQRRQGSVIGERPHLVAVEVFEGLSAGCYYEPPRLA